MITLPPSDCERIPMTKKILSIQNIGCETLGILEPLLLADGYEIQNVLAKELPGHINPELYKAIIVLGGPMSAYDDLEYLNFEKLLIKNAVLEHIPVLGICLGSQLIASALGGRVYKGNQKEIGWHYIDLSKDGREGVFKGISNSRLEVFQWHGDTFELPVNSKILASSELYIQAFKIGTAIGIQFHIEVTEDMINDWLTQYDTEIRTELISSTKISRNIHTKTQNLRKYCLAFYSNFCNFIEQYDSAKKSEFALS
jgi:GMP synthase (glutamine-hydrolysing)